MPLHEFEIIDRFFKKPIKSSYVIKGIGDDAAVFRVPHACDVVTTIDTLVQNTHFFPNAKAFDLGHKSLAVSLSDLAAMGAHPQTALCALTLPKADEEWLLNFSKGFFQLAHQHEVELIGGNITEGPLAISVVAHGFVPKDKAIYREGAKAGDSIYVTGTLGDASCACDCLSRNKPHDSTVLFNRFHRPTPRVQEGLALRGLASAAIDISDGLYADLHKLMVCSKVGAVVYAEKIPLSAELTRCCDLKKALNFALTGGEDYELCFTVPEKNKQKLERIFSELQTPVTEIGTIVSEKTLSVLDSRGNPITVTHEGYEHFENKSRS